MPRLPWQITREMFLAESEVDQLLAHLRGRLGDEDEDGTSAVVDDLIIQVLLFSGLRPTEFCGLTLGDTLLGHGTSALRVIGKSSDMRTVHLPQRVSGLIRAYVQAERGGVPVARAKLSEPLVLNEKGKAYERTGLYRRVKRILTDAGLGERANVQLLRHTYGYLAYKRTGGNLLFVQRQLGHAHPMVTSVYASLVAESYETLADALDGLIPPRDDTGRAANEEGDSAKCRTMKW